MRTVEIRSNIAGDIMKIRKGVVFKEHATVVDELLQNSQRAQAKNVVVDCPHYKPVLQVTDDGVGCKDPQDLFEKNTSAWFAEEEAFGEGFFSVFLLADQLRVRSHDWELSLDVLEMLETKNMKIEVVDGLGHFDGFQVELTGDRIEEYGYMLRTEVETFGPILPMDVVLNGREVKSKMLLEIVSDLDEKIEHELFDAVLCPASGYKEVEFYYENRPVRTDYIVGVTGRVHVKKGAATLKAPDRKEFVYDEKRAALFAALTSQIVRLYKKFIETATDAELDAHEFAIEHYLTVEEYAEVLGVSEKLFGFEQEDKQEDTPVKVAPIDWKFVEGLIETGVEAKSRGEKREKGSLKKLVNKVKSLVYVPVQEVERLKEDIGSAEYNGFTIIYAPNKLYVSALEYYGVARVDKLNEVVETEYLIEKIGPRSKKEQRFSALMARVEDHYGMQPGSIRLAKLGKVDRHVETGEILTYSGEVTGVCKMVDGAVYIDRKIAKLPEYRAQEPDYPNVTVHDMRILMRVMPTLVHELAHLLYGTVDNTLEQSQSERKIGFEIVELF